MDGGFHSAEDQEIICSEIIWKLGEHVSEEGSSDLLRVRVLN